MRAVRLLLITAAAVWCGAMLHRGALLAWDEIEFFRATRWLAEAHLPYRDFWEHHTPLQWFLFAPFARLWGGGAGVAPILAMRWTQLPLWLAIFAVVTALGRRAGAEGWGLWCGATCLLLSPWFVWPALQYRVDHPGHLAYLGALFLMLEGTPRRWMDLCAGALMAAGVLANMRLAPLVIATTLLVTLWSSSERRWSINMRALFIAAGGLSVALAFVLFLAVTGTLHGFLDGVVWYNRMSAALVPDEASSFLRRLVAPFVEKDIAAILFLLAAAAGLVTALRDVRRPGALQLTALLSLVAFVTVAAMRVHYQYHYHTPLLLLFPAAAVAFGRIHVPSWRNVIVGVLAVALAMNLAPLAGSAFGAELQYQNRVLLELDARTRAGDRVWDGCGRGWHRQPAYRYWFLPAGVRLLEQAGLLERYDVEQMSARPPAAILADLRTQFWMNAHPRLAAYVMHHYLPLYQNLWVPGMNAALPAGASRTVWRVPRTGTYDLRLSELLARHPWFTHPAGYIAIEGTDLEIPLDRLPETAAPMQWAVNGKPVAPRSGMLALPAGSQLELVCTLPRPAAVVLVPHGVRTLSVMPEVPLVF